MILRNRPAPVGLLLGVLRAGGCVVAINPDRGEERTRADIEALDLPFVAGEAGDLDRFVSHGQPRQLDQDRRSRRAGGRRHVATAPIAATSGRGSRCGC